MDLTRPVEALIPGAQGRVLEALARTTGELTLRALSEVAHVSPPQASRVLRRLVGLGVVERRDVPPAALFRLAPENLAARLVSELAGLREAFLEELRQAARGVRPPPANVTVFGSVARGEAGPESDVDLLVVRPAGVDEDDPRWSDGLDELAGRARRLCGNPVNLLDAGEEEIPGLLGSRRRVWREIERDGIHIWGAPLADLGAAVA